MPAIVPQKIYDPVGRCIYCGAVGVDLREEHIIPFGIGGRLALPESSCLCCQDKTTRFDSKFQNNMIGDFRVRVRFPNRKGKSKRGKIPINVPSDDGGSERISINAKDYPRMVLLPQFPPPEIVYGKAWDIEPRMLVTTNKNDAQRLAEKHPTGSAATPVKYHIPTFCQMVAKIAHSYAVAEVKPEIFQTFTALLPDIILNAPKTTPTRLIGGDMDLFPPTNDLHEIILWSGLAGETEYLIARIRLFAPMKTPTYHAVVGERPFTGESYAEAPLRLR